MNSANLAFQRYLSALPLNAAAVTDVMGCFSLRVIARDDYFARAGDVQDRLGFVVDGLFVMTVEKPGQPEYVKNFLSKDEFLLAAFDPAAGNLVNIRALRDSRVLEAHYSDIQALYAKHEDFRVLSDRGMQRRYQEICDRLEQMATLDAGGRYALFRQSFGPLEEAIPQYLVASYVGVTPTQLSRIRHKAEID
jgi:CRP-like cAMP-binding protein